MTWVHFSKVQFNNANERREKMWWNKNCHHCGTPLNEETATYCSDRAGYGSQKCDYCFDNCSSFTPCGKWSKDKRYFFLKEGYIEPSLFDKDGKKKPPSGFAAAGYVSPSNKE